MLHGMTQHDIRPGLLVLHGNRLEDLHALVMNCIGRWPLLPLEQEVVLVQSNAAGEWFKAAQAGATGICAASRVELPGRFLWRLYRQVLGAELPQASALDRAPMVWRLLRLLPGLAAREGFAALDVGADQARAHALAQRLAELFDQYQVYRADWLEAWARGADAVTDARGRAQPLPSALAWQPALWRALLDGLDGDALRALRPRVHARVLQRLRAGTAAAAPRRVVVFGASTLPRQTLEALDALSLRAQVIVAVFNPCRYHWGDIVEGRELLRDVQRRGALRDGIDLAAVALHDMHDHAHPLLAAWGRQGRDFMRQLDALERDAALPALAGIGATEVYDDAPGASLLQQVQGAVRDLLPLREHAFAPVAAGDRSIVFQRAHGAQREVEVLHDQLLDLLAVGDGLRPQDIVVMAPDIAAFAPHVHAVFGQYRRDDARSIPYEVVDRGARELGSMRRALDWLLRADAARCSASELFDLLDCPAVASALGLDGDDRPLLARWLQGAGMRWGLDAAQRADIGLDGCGDIGTLAAGVERLLLGYASGDAGAFDAVEPYAQVGGLESRVLGVVGELLTRLRALRAQLRTPAAPRQWAQRGRALLEHWFAVGDEAEQLALAAMHKALDDWEDDCARAGFDGELIVAVFRDAWLGGLETIAAGGRFLASGVTFCSLLPLRSVPFRVVCLIGMNDGAFPQDEPRVDFDLMAQAGLSRPGDRSRREDDRYLMLEALLSARQCFSVSWSGRSPRDDSEQPPSVLVAQLRDYLAAGWRAVDGDGALLLRQRTTEHPLQPFSRRYFDGGSLHTHAREWFAAHDPGHAAAAAAVPAGGRVAAAADTALGLRDLAALLRNPVKLYFRRSLDVDFDDAGAGVLDDEPFVLDGLDRHRALRRLLDDPQQLPRRLDGLAADAVLPWARPGAQAAQELAALARPMLRSWRALGAQHDGPTHKLALRFDDGATRLDDWVDGLRGQPPAWIELTASTLLRGRKVRADCLLDAWLRAVACAACAQPLGGWLIGPDAVLRLPPLEPEPARDYLRAVLRSWREALRTPLPWTLRTALASAAGDDARTVYEGRRGGTPGEGSEPCMARVYPDFAALCADPRHLRDSQTLFAPLLAWAREAVEVQPHADAEHADG